MVFIMKTHLQKWLIFEGALILVHLYFLVMNMLCEKGGNYTEIQTIKLTGNLLQN